MDKCGICNKPAVQLFETGKNDVFACFKCQPLVPEVTLDDPTSEQNAVKIEEVNIDSLYCSLCNKMFQKNIQLQNHLRNHRAERRFVCTYCNKAFSQSNNLRAHLRIHTNERPYKCTECGKAFTQVTNLNNHVRLHTGERPFVCPEPGCNKAFAQVTNLNQHKKRHINGRPLESTYDCTVCGEQFDQRNHMYSHRREVHADVKVALKGSTEGQHLCKLCSHSFSSEHQLMEHVAEHFTGGLQDNQECGVLKCVFPSCSVRVSCAREHTEHLLRAHQLRVLTAPTQHTPPRRGRPPKSTKMDRLDPEENCLYGVTINNVTSIKEEPLFLPKLKVQNMFQ